MSGRESLLPFTNRLTVSTPAEMNTSPSPALIAWKAIRVVCRARRAVAGQGGAGQVVHAEEDGDHAGHVETLFAAGEPAAEHQVLDVRRFELRDLRQRRTDHLDREVVGPESTGASP